MGCLCGGVSGDCLLACGGVFTCFGVGWEVRIRGHLGVKWDKGCVG